MSSEESLRQKITAGIDAERDRIISTSEDVRKNPEIGYEEHRTVRTLTNAIDEFGFKIEHSLGGLDTAFRASIDGYAPGPTIAVLTHYDALPEIGHGCGHNLIAASAVAAAAGIGAISGDFPGRFEIIGTPAEEGGAGKVLLQEAGVFEDVDAALMLHHGGNQTTIATEYPDGTSLAVAHIDVEYVGQTAHAGADPHNGRNALNGVIKFFNGVDSLRQHVPMSTRLHGIITHGGAAPNIVPGYAACKYYVRAESRQELDTVLDSVKKIARAAADMTLTESTVNVHSICNDMRPNYAVGTRYRQNAESAGITITLDHEGKAYHSSDFGNVSHLMPAVMAFFAIADQPIPGHSQEVVDASGSEFGYEQLIKMSKAMTLTALDLLTDGELLEQAKSEHRQRFG